MLQLIDFFKQHSKRVIFASPAQLSEHRVELTQLGIEEQSITLNCASFDQWISQINPDLVLFDRFMMEEQFGWRVEQQCPDCIRILDTEDLHSLREARHQQLKSALKNNLEVNPDFEHSTKLPLLMSKLDICQREIASIYRCDLSLMISKFEMELLEQHYQLPPHILLHLPFMLDTESARLEKPYSQREHFVTIGNFRHAPNWDCVLWLKSAIWPKVRKILPDAQLHIYGAYPAKKVTDLHNPKQGFHIKGWAPDAFEVLSNARVCLSPLRFGAGIKGKFTDAMLCATPSVTTDLGAESMSGQHPWPGAIENNSTQIALVASALYQDHSLWEKASKQGAVILNDDYNQNHLKKKLECAIADLQQHLASKRLSNFTGLMLRHHHHKSTKYMAQWIAAKQRYNDKN